MGCRFPRSCPRSRRRALETHTKGTPQTNFFIVLSFSLSLLGCALALQLVQDGIHRQKLGSLMVEVNNITRKLMNKLKKNHSDGTPVDILTNINHVLFDAFGKFGYGVEFNTLDGQNKEVFEHGMVYAFLEF